MNAFAIVCAILAVGCGAAISTEQPPYDFVTNLIGCLTLVFFAAAIGFGLAGAFA